jgi:pimeloyl-ACP methyl ester carboxylesterase
MDFVNAPGGGFKGLPVVFQTGMLQNTSTLKPLFASPPPPLFTCEDAKAIKTPTLLVEGVLTQRFRSLIVDELGRCLPNVERVKVANSGHPLEMMQPKDFNSSVLLFLTKH